jgi:ankyrin repeat protein
MAITGTNRSLEARVTRAVLTTAVLLGVAAVPLLSQARPGELARAIQEGRHAAALGMIKAGANVNEAQPDGTRPVHWAVYRIDYDVLDALIAKKARVDVANEFGHTPLAEAVKQGDARMVKTLLSAGSGSEGANADGQTALMVAIKNGDLPIFRMLIDAGARVNVVEKVQDQTPLMWAAAATRNTAEMVRGLIAKGASVNARAKFVDWPSQITSEPRAQYHAYGGLTPLLYAARSGCYACVDALLGAGADVNLPTPEGVTAIMIALDNGHNGVARLLMERGGNPHVWDVYGRTALYIAVGNSGGPAAGRGGPGAAAPGAGGAPAARGGQPPAALAAPAGQGRGGARAGGQGGRAGGQGAVGAADSGPQVSALEMINLLLAAGVDINAQLNMRRPSNQGGRFNDPLLSTGTTPLLRALINNDAPLVRLLLDKGANPNIYGMGLSPWLYAAGITSGTFNEARGGVVGSVDTSLLDLMLAHGADINAQVTGAASYSGRIARALTGDPVNTKSNEGMTALHVAARSRNASFVRYLLDRGARTDIRDASGRTPLDVLNGVPAFQPAIFADADGVVPPNANAAPAAPAPAGAGRGGGAGDRGAGNPAAVEEIRALLQRAPQHQPN